MPDQSEKKQKREYRKGNPLTRAEYSQRAEAIKARTHKLIRTYVPYDIANEFKELCKERGVSQQEAISLAMLDYIVKLKEENQNGFSVNS